MDKTVRVLLSVGIGILFPLVVYFTVVTIVPSKQYSSYPEYPDCQQEKYDYYSKEYTTDYDCKAKYEEYEKQKDSYEAYVKSNEDLDIIRGQIALVIAVLTIIGMLFIKDQKEITGGLVFGSTLVVIGAISTMLSGYDLDEATEALNSFLSIFAFLGLVGVMYFVDKSYPSDDLRSNNHIPPENKPYQEPAIMHKEHNTHAPEAQPLAQKTDSIE